MTSILEILGLFIYIMLNTCIRAVINRGTGSFIVVFLKLFIIITQYLFAEQFKLLFFKLHYPYVLALLFLATHSQCTNATTPNQGSGSHLMLDVVQREPSCREFQSKSYIWMQPDHEHKAAMRKCTMDILKTISALSQRSQWYMTGWFVTRDCKVMFFLPGTWIAVLRSIIYKYLRQHFQ